MSEPTPGLHLTLPATSENVAVVRHAVAGLAETLGMDEVGIADLKTVVTEACMNVVVHAYDGGQGPLEVEAEAADGALAVAVRDFGAGIRPRAEIGGTSLRLGLPLIAALSRSFEISGGLGRGTCVAVEIPLASTDEAEEAAAAARPQGGEATTLTVNEPEVLGPVLARVVGALAARREVTIDRLSDALLLTDAISADAPSVFADGRVRVDLSDREDGIDLRIGPMETGAGERLRRGLDLPDVGGSLETLADELTVERNGEGDYLLVRFSATAN
jgi:anti-sigma regulatory factor (Ser/Thr protein kinase)